MRGSSEVKDKDEKKRDGDNGDGGAGDKNKAGGRGWEEVRIPLREAGEWRSRQNQLTSESWRGGGSSYSSECEQLKHFVLSE